MSVMDEDNEELVSEPEPEANHGTSIDVFTRAADLQTHVERYHEGLLDVIEEDLENERDIHESCDERSTEIDKVYDTSLEQDLRCLSETRTMEELNCEICGDVFDTAGDLETHEERYHLGSEHCMFCTFRGSKMDLVAHLSSDCSFGEEEKVSKPDDNSSLDNKCES